MDAGCKRRTRDMSPERIKTSSLEAKPKPIIRRAQVVYYLTRNGNLEHPHFMEVTHLANQPLRLQDVMKRLAAVRGEAMPSLYSWSCKRSYRNGYVWHDLAENDIIYPSDGAEYVLKGSELVEGASERFRGFHTGSKSTTHVHGLKHHHLHHRHHSCMEKPRNGCQDNEETEKEAFEDRSFSQASEAGGEEVHGDELEEDYGNEGEKKSDTSSTTPQSLCSRGVSTEELEQLNQEREQNNRNPAAKHSAHPQSSQSTRHTPTASIVSETPSSRHASKRFEEGDRGELAPSRNSVLLQLIACGAGMKPVGAKKASEGPNRGFMCKHVPRAAEEEDREVIRSMSENPRFGNSQPEDKEYFSGSIVESTSGIVEAGSVLKRSNSYNEESHKASTDQVRVRGDEDKGMDDSAKGVCLPLKICKQTRK